MRRKIWLTCLSLIAIIPFNGNYSLAQENYKSIKIGQQEWMSENLNVNTFRNGDSIPQAKTIDDWRRLNEEGKPAWCYYNDKIKNGKKYGKLYNWYAVNDPRGLAPQGWHIPSDEDWDTLIDYLGGDIIASKKMMSSKGRKKTYDGNNISGFNGLPAGARFDEGDFHTRGYGAWFWSSTENNSSTSISLVLTSINLPITGDCPKGYGLSCRCIRDMGSPASSIDNDLSVRKGKIIIDTYSNSKRDCLYGNINRLYLCSDSTYIFKQSVAMGYISYTYREEGTFRRKDSTIRLYSKEYLLTTYDTSKYKRKRQVKKCSVNDDAINFYTGKGKDEEYIRLSRQKKAN